MKREEIIHTDIFKNRKVIAEIGVLRGKFASNLLSMNPTELHLIDPWTLFKQDYPNKSLQKWEDNYQFIVKKFSQNKNVIIKRLTSENASTVYPNNYFDFVYIDANHSYESVKHDISLWLPKVKKGGILGGHDIDTPSVAKAVYEAFDKKDTFKTNEYDLHPTIKYAESWFYIKK